MSSPEDGNCNGGDMETEEEVSRGEEEHEDNRFSGGGGDKEIPGGGDEGREKGGGEDKEMEKRGEYGGGTESGSLVQYEEDSGEEDTDTHESRKRARSDSGAESDTSKIEDKSTLLVPDNLAKRAKLDLIVSSGDKHVEQIEAKELSLGSGEGSAAQIKIRQSVEDEDMEERQSVDGEGIKEVQSVDGDIHDKYKDDGKEPVGENKLQNGNKIEDVKDEEKQDTVEKNAGDIQECLVEDNCQMTNQEKVEDDAKNGENEDIEIPQDDNSSDDSSDSDIDLPANKKRVNIFSNECLDDNEAEDTEGESSNDSFFELGKKVAEMPEAAEAEEGNEHNEGTSETGEDFENQMSNEHDFDDDDREDENKNDSEENYDEDEVVDLDDDEDDGDVYGEEDQDEAKQSRQYSSYASQQTEPASTSSTKPKDNKLYVMKWVSCDSDEGARSEESDSSQYLDLNNVSELSKVLPQILAKMPKEFLRNLPNLLREVDPQAKEYLDEAYRQPSLPGYGGASMGSLGYPPPHRFPSHGGLMPMYPQQAAMGFPGYSGLPLSHQMQQQQYFEQQQRLLLQQQQQAAARPPPARSPPPPPVKKYCEYPEPDTNEGVAKVTVAPADYQCLKKDQFLNDVVIDFFLKYLQYGKFPSAVRDNIHVFSTYFYDTLTKKRGGEVRESDPEKAAFKRYDRVKRWTRKVDLFEKDFIVVPINENYHWYVCIICFPGLNGPVDMETGEPCELPKKQVKRSKKKQRKVRLATAKSIRSEETQNKDRDEAEGDEIDMEDEEDKYEKKKRRRKIVKQVRENEMDTSFEYSQNGQGFADENMYSEDYEGYYYDQEGDNEGGEEEEIEAEEDIDNAEDIFDSDGGVIASSEGDFIPEDITGDVSEDVEDENVNSSLDETDLDTEKTPQEYQVEQEDSHNDEEEDFDESDEEKVEPKMEDEEEELVEVSKDVDANIVKHKPHETFHNDPGFSLDKTDEVQITTDITESRNDSENDKVNLDSSSVDNPIVDDQEMATDSKLEDESLKSSAQVNKIEGDVNEEEKSKKLDNGEVKEVNGGTENINGEIQESADECDVVQENCQEIGESKDKEMNIDNIGQVDGTIDIKDEDESGNTEEKEPEEQAEDTSNVSQTEGDQVKVEQSKESTETSSRNDDEPIITLKMVGNNEPDSEIVKLELETQLPVTENSAIDNKESSSDVEDDVVKQVEAEDKGDVLIDESTETLEEQEVVVAIKPLESNKSNEISQEKNSTESQQEMKDTVKESELLKNDSKHDTVADLKSEWSDQEDEDMETETKRKTCNSDDSNIIPNKNQQEREVDIQVESKKGVPGDEEVESETVGDPESLEEGNEYEEKFGDESVEEIDDDMGDVTVEQMEEEDAVMESDEDEVTLKQPEMFKMPVLPQGMTINRQRDPVLDDFENLQHNIENHFDNRSSDEDLSEEELEEESLDDVGHQNGLPPSVFERLLQNREAGFNDDSEYRTRQEESEYEESDIESSEDEEEEEELRPVKQPCILVFDSLGGTKFRKSKVCNTIREYLNCEYKTKINKDHNKFTKEYMPASSPKVQQQPNFSDCGIYLLQFVESFFTTPIQDFTLPITSIKQWFPEEGEQGVKNKRSNIAKLIRELTDKQNPGKDIRFPNLVFGSAPAAEPQEEAEEEWNSDGEDRYSDEGSMEDDNSFNMEQQYQDYKDYRPHQMFGAPPSTGGRMASYQGMQGMQAQSGVMSAQHHNINLPPGVSITRNVENVLDDTEELESSDDDIIVDEGEEKQQEWVEYVDEFGRTRQCRKEEVPKQGIYEEQLYEEQGEYWENQYEEDTEDYMEQSNPSSPLQIIEEGYDLQPQELEGRVSPYISMVSHQVGRFSPYVSMVSHQPVTQPVLEQRRNCAHNCVSMVTHQVYSRGNDITEDTTAIEDIAIDLQESDEIDGVHSKMLLDASTSQMKAPGAPLDDSDVVPLDDSDVEMSVDETLSQFEAGDSTPPLVEIPLKPSDNANVEKIPVLEEDLQLGARGEDSKETVTTLEDSKEQSIEVLNEEKIGQVDGSIDLKDDDDLEESVTVEEFEEQTEQAGSDDSGSGEELAGLSEASCVYDMRSIVSDILDTVHISAQMAHNVPQLNLYSSHHFEEQVIDDESSDSEVEVDNDGLDTPVIDSLDTSNPFFRASSIQATHLFGEGVAVQQYSQTNSLEDILMNRGVPYQQPERLPPHQIDGPDLSELASLPGLSMTSSRHIPTFQNAFTAPGPTNNHNKAPKLAQVNLLTDSEDEDDCPGDVFIKGNRVYQRRGKKQGRVAKFLCRDERGEVSVRSELPKPLPPPPQFSDMLASRGEGPFSNFWEMASQNRNTPKTDIKSSHLANEEIDAFYSHDEDENDEVYPVQSFSRSKVSSTQHLGEGSDDCEENIEDISAQTIKDDDW